jgi:hypothetical protein
MSRVDENEVVTGSKASQMTQALIQLWLPALWSLKGIFDIQIPDDQAE